MDTDNKDWLNEGPSDWQNMSYFETPEVGITGYFCFGQSCGCIRKLTVISILVQKIYCSQIENCIKIYLTGNGPQIIHITFCTVMSKMPILAVSKN